MGLKSGKELSCSVAGPTYFEYVHFIADLFRRLKKKRLHREVWGRQKLNLIESKKYHGTCTYEVSVMFACYLQLSPRLLTRVLEEQR